MNRKSVVGLGVLLLAVGIFVIWQNQQQPTSNQVAIAIPIVHVSLPAQLTTKAQTGKRRFEANCVSCHGENAAGQEGIAPPLVHKIYEPSHHGDESFQRAAALGVRAHHWPFGNMPSIEGLNRSEISDIIAYIRELQRANGIF